MCWLEAINTRSWRLSVGRCRSLRNRIHLGTVMLRYVLHEVLGANARQSLKVRDEIMTHILFVTPYYPPEITAPAVRIGETAMRLVKRGHQVTVLTTFPNFPTGIVPPEYRGRVIQHEMHDGVRIVRVWSYFSPNKGFLRRILAQLSFGCLAPFLGWKAIGRPDVIIVESPPLFDAIAGCLLAFFKRRPFIFTVADLWPEAAIQMGILS